MNKIVLSIFTAVGLMVSAILLPAVANAGDKQKVVYHVADEDKVNFALGNIRNHIEGVGGADKVDIILVVHGPGLKAFHEFGTTDVIKQKVADLQQDGVKFNACGNTMRAQKVDTKDLVPGFVRVDQGGVVRIAELQSQGYLYIRP